MCQSTRLAPTQPDAWRSLGRRNIYTYIFVYCLSITLNQLACVLREEIPALTCVPSINLCITAYSAALRAPRMHKRVLVLKPGLEIQVGNRSPGWYSSIYNSM